MNADYLFHYSDPKPALQGRALTSVNSQVTVAVVRTGDVLTDRPGGELVTKFTATGEDRYFLMQTGDKGEIQTNITVQS